MVPPSGPTGTFTFRLEWIIDWTNEPDIREHFVKIKFTVRRVGARSVMPVRVMTPDTVGVVGIDITTHPALTRIMHHEFAVADGSAFDPSPLREYLKGLTIQQKQLLIRSALATDFPEGRLVVFVTLYKRSERRMYADWTDTSDGVIPNARFSVFFCRDNNKMKVRHPSTSPITLICHTEYLCVCLRNEPTINWLKPPPNSRNAPGMYNGRRPNEWLRKDTQAPVRFAIAALQPTSKVSSRGIWHAIYEYKSGQNIMPGNSLHGMINTRGCWMLFRNFNWPVKIREELYYIYRKIERTKGGKGAVKAALKTKACHQGVCYDFEPQTGSTHSSSYDKFISYDRNWAYLWFCHEIVGIKYYSDTDFWEKKKTVNDYKVAGREMLNKFPLSEAGKQPEYNLPEEASLSYHEFDHHHPNVTIGRSLFRENALGIKTASDFSKDMQSPLTRAQMVNSTWADVYFYKEANVNADDLSRNDVEEK